MMLSFLKCFLPKKIIKVQPEQIKVQIKNNTQKMLIEFASQHDLALIDLSNKTICLLLDKGCCHYLNKGVCSLAMTAEEAEKEEKIIDSNTGIIFTDAHASHCRGILNRIQDENYLMELFNNGTNAVAIRQAKCGHYICNGQHRLCVAKHAGLTIPLTEKSEIRSKINCAVCRGEYSVLYE